jgi:hypothetical protein
VSPLATTNSRCKAIGFQRGEVRVRVANRTLRSGSMPNSTKRGTGSLRLVRARRKLDHAAMD